MAVGEVKWFSVQKGYGFIAPDDGPKDVFVHITALRDSGLETLTDGQRVEFELRQLGDGRLNAHGLKLLEDADAEAGEAG